MDFEQLRQELARLNILRYKVTRTEERRRDLYNEKWDYFATPGVIAYEMQVLNSEPLTWDDLHREVAALEERIVRETGFGVEYLSHSIDGEEISGSYVLIPKNEGWLESKRRQG